MTDHYLMHGPSSRCPCGRTVYASDGDCHARCEVCRQVREIGEEIGTYGVCVECIVKWAQTVDWEEWADVREAFDVVLKGRQVDDIGIADLERLYIVTGGGGVKPYYQDDFCTIYHGDERLIEMWNIAEE